jgi:glycosyltransferase involved in cell wall biosynthesis
MDILMVETGGWGGIGHYAHYLCSAIQEKGVPVCLVTHAVNYQLESVPKYYEVSKLFRGDGFVQDWKRLYRMVRTHSCKIVHFQSLLSTRRDWLIFLAVGALCSTPKFIYTVHNVLPHEILPGEKLSYRGLYAAAEGLIAHSNISRDRILAMMGPRFKTPVKVIPPGHFGEIAGAEQLSRARAKKILDLKDYSYIVFFGTVRPYKGVHNLLRAVAECSQWPVDLRVLIAGQPGKGVSTRELLELSNRPVIRERVELKLQYFPDKVIPAIFKIADLVVLPYLNIDQSGILMAAMAAGRPVLCTPVGGFPETVHPAIGFLAANTSHQALTQALNAAIANRDSWKAMGARARKDAEHKFSWETIAAETIEFYKTIHTSLHVSHK